MNDEVNEVLKFIKDSLTKPKRHVYEDKEFEDPHVHFPIPKDKEDLEHILDIVFKKVDRCAMTDWGHNVGNSLRYDHFVQKIVEGYKGKYEIKPNGVVTKIKYGDREVLIIKSQENYTKQRVHITAEGCEEIFPQGLDVRDLIEKIQKAKGIAIIEHPGTKNYPLLQYWYTNKKELEFIESLFLDVDGVEVFNATNSLWMSIANGTAKRLVETYINKKISAVAGSDAHFYPEIIGHAGIYLPKHDLKGLTGKEIIAFKKQDLKNSEILLYQHYLGPIDFFKSMVLNPYKVL